MMVPTPPVQAKPLVEIGRSFASWVGSFEPFRSSRTF